MTDRDQVFVAVGVKEKVGLGSHVLGDLGRLQQPMDVIALLALCCRMACCAITDFVLGSVTISLPRGPICIYDESILAWLCRVAMYRCVELNLRAMQHSSSCTSSGKVKII